MAPFDPAAAAAAWLARIPAARRMAAQAATDQAALLWLAQGAVAILAAWLVLRSGLLRPRRPTAKPWLDAAERALVLSLAVGAALALFGLAIRGVAPAEAVGGVALVSFAAVVAVPLLYALIRRSTRAWWAIAGAAAAAACLVLVAGPFAAAPRLPPLPEGPTRNGLARLLSDTGMPGGRIVLSDSAEARADIIGPAGSPSVIVSRPLLEQAGVAEIRAEVAHLLSHYRHRDQLALAVLYAALAAVGFATAGLLYRPLARLTGAPADVSDPAGAPVLLIVAVLWLGLSTLAVGAFVRAINVRADQEALDLAREPDGLAAWLLREWDGKAVDPGPLTEAVLYTHPPLASRIRHAMDWKAARQATP